MIFPTFMAVAIMILTLLGLGLIKINTVSANFNNPRPRVRPRFFDQVGHETMYASSGNKHFFTKSCHRQTYQNYEQSRQKLGTFLVNKVL